MSRRLYIFVDESGTPHEGDYYTVAACWCISHRNDISAVLNPTKNTLSSYLQTEFTGKPVSELKAADLPPGILDDLFQNIEGAVYEDKTVKNRNFPWVGGRPIRFTTHNISPDIGNGILKDTFGSNVHAPETLKTMGLVSVLNPLFYPDQIRREHFDEAHIALDASVWENARRRVEKGLRIQDGLSEITSMSTLDSKSTPGIQIADLAAYSWARNLRRGDCLEAKNCVSGLLF